MIERLLTFLRCPACRAELDVYPFAPADGEEISEALLRCERGHWYPVVGGVPRVLPEAMRDHWDRISENGNHLPVEIRDRHALPVGTQESDRSTQASFSNEWALHELGGRTWGMALDERVRTVFVEPLGMSPEELEGKVVLDAGCGNGSQSVAYTELGVEVLAIDLSTGVERGQAYRDRHPGARPENVHFIQADLRYPPIAPASVDIIHSVGVLHHTPDTAETFHALLPLLRPGGVFYVWLLGHERGVTPVINVLRAVTTRIPSHLFAHIAAVMAVPFLGFRAAANALGLRSYAPISRKEATVSLIDIFGAPNAHSHTYEEVAGWYRRAGFEDVRFCNPDRRGFGVCGRLRAESRALSAVAAA